jgi:hypothetical protein
MRLCDGGSLTIVSQNRNALKTVDIAMRKDTSNPWIFHSKNETKRNLNIGNSSNATNINRNHSEN